MFIAHKSPSVSSGCLKHDGGVLGCDRWFATPGLHRNNHDWRPDPSHPDYASFRVTLGEAACGVRAGNGRFLQIVVKNV